jgi:UDP-N-acetylmuramoylalanine-D-glutamate ligase
VTHALVLGAGVSGLAAARLARSRGVSVTIYDRRPSAAAISEGFGVASGEWDHLLLRGIDLVIASPGFSERSAPVVEITGVGRHWWGMEYAWDIEEPGYRRYRDQSGRQLSPRRHLRCAEAWRAAPVAGTSVSSPNSLESV